jgi:putative DNA-invertase from lambdoid prophage Rac
MKRTYLKRLDDYGVGFRSFTEPNLDSGGMFRDAVISILAVIAKQERVRISERVRAGLDRARENGTKTGRPVGRPRVVFRRDEAVELREHGGSWGQIAKQLSVSVASIRGPVTIPVLRLSAARNLAMHFGTGRKTHCLDAKN